MNPGTIIYAGNFALPDRNAAANRVVNNGKLFRALGYNTVFLGADRESPYFEGIQKREYDFGFDMYEQAYPRTTRQWAREIFNVDNISALVNAYPDTRAVLLYNTQLATLLQTKKAIAGTGVRVLYDCTEWNGRTEGAFPKRAVKRLDSIWIERRLQAHADGIICVSTKMEQHYKGKVPVLRLPPLVNTEDPIWRQTPAETPEFTFCYAGSPSDKDRIDLLIEAFAPFKETAGLTVIGLTQEEFSACYPHISTYGVCFTGRLTHAETVRHILGCGCFVFLRERSRRNNAGFPTKFAEASTCGGNVITTDVSDIALYADPRTAVLPDVSAGGLQNAMRDAMRDVPASRALRSTFDYRRYTDETRLWLERIPCKED